MSTATEAVARRLIRDVTRLPVSAYDASAVFHAMAHHRTDVLACTPCQAKGTQFITLLRLRAPR